MDNDLSNFIVITPVKNEEQFLPLLKQSILEQTFKPRLWIIVDDGSTDDSPKLIKIFETKYNWIRSLRINSKERYHINRYGFIVRKGLGYAYIVCEKERIRCDYIALVDADMVLDTNYFKEILRAFRSDEQLGIASGVFYEKERSVFTIQKTIDGPNICGAALVFRKECDDEIGGFPKTVCPDTISITKALNRGWRIKVVTSTRCFHLRPTSGRGSLWIGYLRGGEDAYTLNYHPVNAILTGLYYSLFKPPYYVGVAYVVGYLKNMLLRRGKIQDEEVREYFWNSFNRRFK